MNPIYNSHILRWKNVIWLENQGSLMESIRECQGSQVLARIRQAGRLVEVADPNGNLHQQLQLNNINLKAAFDLEIITRKPQAIKSEPTSPRSAEEGFVDRNDFNSLQWNGERGTGALVSSRVRNSPMFFRSNGMNADLVDLYSGQTLFIVLNGGSLEEFDWAKLKKPGICTLGVNNGAHAFRPNFWTCVDDPTRFMRSIWADPTITKFIPMAHFEKPIWDTDKDAISDWRVKDFPNVYGYRRNEAFKPAQWLFEDTINWGNHSKLGGGRSVMLAALRIAFLLGFRKVCLLGCDFYMDDNHRYWFAEERSKHAISNNQNSYRILTGFFEQLQPLFLASGFKVFNCNPFSHLKVFPQADLDEELKKAEIDTSNSTRGMYVDRYKTQKQTANAKAPVAGVRSGPPKPEKPVNRKPPEAQVLEEVIRAFKAATIQRDPFMHVRLESVFSDTIYRSLLRNLPDDEDYQELRHPDAMSADGKSSRLKFGFTPREVGALAGPKQIFWSHVRSALQDRRLETTIRVVFKEALEKRFGRNFGSMSFRPHLELLRDTRGYRIGVHPDIPQKAITVQFYLPTDASQIDSGTLYYKRRAEGDFEVVKKMDFLPKTGHAFVVNDNSFHGAETKIEEGFSRNSLMLTYYLRER